MNYQDVSSSIQWGNSGPVTCISPLTINNPMLPPSNTATFTGFSNSTYSVNTSCSAYTNLSYTATNYLPIQSINAQSNPTLSTNHTNYYFNTNTVPVCSNLNDSLNIYFGYSNLYACGGLTTSRTYSFFIDNVLLDMAVSTGSAAYNFVNGSASKCSVSESYSNSNTTFWMRVALPTGLTLGNHLFEIKSTPLYTSPASVVNYSCNLNLQPCISVSGKLYEDCDNNCVKNTGDGNLYGGALVKVFNGITSHTLYPDGAGNYSGLIPSPGPQYSITSIPSASGFTPCPAATATTALTSSMVTNLDFGYKTNTSYGDVSTYNAIIPGGIFPSQSKVVSSGWINQAFYYTPCTSTFVTNPGKFKIVLDKNLTYLNPTGPTPTPNAVITGPSGDTLVWNVSDFNGSVSYQYYTVLAQLASSVTIGSIFTNYTFVNPQYDNFMSNNSSVFSWTVGLPYDPNNKLCYASGIQPNGDIPLGTTDLYYTINFQNIGTAAATNVKTIDTLDTNLDWATLQTLSSSFPVQTQVDNTSGQVIFYFANINLPDSNTNEPGSHGFVNYKIKLKPGVPVNTVIKNRAHNYFDFQAGIPTNQTQNKLVNITGITEMEKVNSVFVAPNPVSDKVTISSREIIQFVSVFNNLGQIVLKQEVNALQSQLDLSQLPSSVYFINIQLKQGSGITKKISKTN